MNVHAKAQKRIDQQREWRAASGDAYPDYGSLVYDLLIAEMCRVQRLRADVAMWRRRALAG